jgi:hypothetical protein
VVAAEDRERGDTAHRRDLNDVAVPLRAQNRQHRLRHMQRAEQLSSECRMAASVWHKCSNCSCVIFHLSVAALSAACLAFFGPGIGITSGLLVISQLSATLSNSGVMRLRYLVHYLEQWLELVTL